MDLDNELFAYQNVSLCAPQFRELVGHLQSKKNNGDLDRSLKGFILEGAQILLCVILQKNNFSLPVFFTSSFLNIARTCLNLFGNAKKKKKITLV